MRFTTKLMAVTAGLVISSAALASDAIVGQWKMSEKGEEKAIIAISKSGSGYQGVMTKGLTEKAKKREGQVVLTNIKEVSAGKYTASGKHPTLPISGTVDITLNGKNITLKSRAGTQTGVKQ